jgi:hypothetical protein
MSNTISLGISPAEAGKLVPRIKDLTHKIYGGKLPEREAQCFALLEKLSASDLDPSPDEINLIVEILAAWAPILKAPM